VVNHFLHGLSRTRRGINDPNFWYFRVEAFGKSLHLNVTEARPLMSSRAVVQTVDNNGSSTYKKISRGIHYTGHVISDPESLVAISGNRGLVSEKPFIQLAFQIVSPFPYVSFDRLVLV